MCDFKSSGVPVSPLAGGKAQRELLSDSCVEEKDIRSRRSLSGVMGCRIRRCTFRKVLKFWFEGLAIMYCFS